MKLIMNSLFSCGGPTRTNDHQLVDMNPTSVKKKESMKLIMNSLFSCGGPTRTNVHQLVDMNPTSVKKKNP